MFRNSEFIQSLIRLVIGLLTYIYLALGIESQYFTIPPDTLNLLSLVFFPSSLAILFSLYWIPVSNARRYLSLAFDITSATVLSYFTGGINSVYVLVYLWIYIGYGSRYGKNFMLAAVIMTLIGYNILVLSENAWQSLTLDAIAYMLLIVALPFYLYSLQKRLQRALEEAEQSNRAKSEFLSTMTHQIRTPIGGVVGMIDLLNKTKLDAQQRQYLQALTQSSNALQEIIEDVVDFPQIEQGAIHLEDKTIQPRNLIGSLMHSLAPLAHEKNIELNYYFAQTFPWRIYNDSQRLRQLLSNLVRHAIDQCHEREVYLYAYAGGANSNRQSDVHIEIHYAQAASDKPLLTSDLESGEDNMPLRIAAQLARLMGGILDIRREADDTNVISLAFSWRVDELVAPDSVANFSGRSVLIYETNATNRKILEEYCNQMQLITHTTDSADNMIAHIMWSQSKQKPFDAIILCDSLARSQAHELVHRIHHEAHCTTPILYANYINSLGRGIGLAGEVDMTISKPLSLEQLAIALEHLINRKQCAMTKREAAQRRILLAEDSEINASILYTHLTDMGHNVDIATDGNTALYAMHQHHYDIVFMDLHMPNMDGIETTQRWRRIESRNPPLPIVAITAKATSNDKKKCMQAGMTGFLTKPVSAQQLEEALRNYL